MNTEKVQFERTLTRSDLLVIAVGQIVGAGIFSLLPAAIGMTGKSASLAFIIAAFISILAALPRILIFSTVRFNGGDYSSLAFLISEKVAGAYVVVHVLARLSFALYALSFADYFISGIYPVDAKVLSIAVLTFFMVINLLGVKSAARFQYLFIVVLLVSIVIFCVYGVPHVQPGYLERPFLQSGVTGLLSAAALLTFATGGCEAIGNLSGEAINPTKDIPWAMGVSTIGVAVLYAVMAVVASGVLPVEQVANQPLTLVAEKILPEPLFYLFVVGGAMFALLTTINSQFASAPQVLVQASQDGWLPKSFGKLNNRFKTPHWIILGFYLSGVLPIIFDISMAEIGGSMVFISQVIIFTLCFAALRLSVVFEKEWKESAFYMSSSSLKKLSILILSSCVLTAYMSLRSLDMDLIILNIIGTSTAIAFGVLVHKYGNVTVSKSYESNQ